MNITSYLPQQKTINQYIADGTTAVFNYTYLILIEEDIAVYVTQPTDAANPDKDLCILNQDYTVQDTGTMTGGTITFVQDKIPSNGSIVTLVRSMQVSIDTEFGNAQTFNGHTLDAAFERVLLIMQQFQTELDTDSLQYVINSYLPSNLSNKLPILTTKDNQVWLSRNGQIIAAQIENTNVSTLRSELASQFPNGGDGTGLIGYYDNIQKQGLTLQAFLNQLQTYIKYLHDFLPIPEPDGLSEGLPVYYGKGSLFIYDGDVGKIFAAVYPKAQMGELLCVGTRYLRSGSSADNIPYLRLAKKLWNEETGYYRFGTSTSFVTANLNANNQLILTTNRIHAARASTAGTSGFTIETPFAGNNYAVNAFLSSDYPNRVYVQGKIAASVTAPDVQTSGFNIVQLRNVAGVKPLFYINCTAANNLAGKWFKFANTINTFGVWFTVNGQGTNPVPSYLTAILLPLLSTHTARDVAIYLAEFIGGHQLTRITCTDASTIKPGDYWTFSTSAANFNVFARINGQGEPPTISGTNIPVDFVQSDTLAQVVQKIKIAINQFYFAVPDLQDTFIRGWNQDGSVKVDDRYFNYGQGLINNAIGSFQFDEIYSHHHSSRNGNFALLNPNTSVTAFAGGDNSLGSSNITVDFGGKESRPSNFAANFVIKY